MFLIDDEPPRGKKPKNLYILQRYESPDEYEEYFEASCLPFLQKVKGNCTFIICGASLISGASLRIMQEVAQNCKSQIELLYVRPETELLSETKKLQERVVYNVMQQYARSGVLKRMMIVSNENLSSIIGQVPLVDHFDKINEVISSTFHMINVLDNTKSIVDTFSPLRPTSRIGTYCAFTPGSKMSENSFANISDLTEAKFYYGIPESQLKEESGLYREVLKEMKKRVEVFQKVSYGIYETSYDTKIGYGVLYTNQIQQ